MLCALTSAITIHRCLPVDFLASVLLLACSSDFGAGTFSFLSIWRLSDIGGSRTGIECVVSRRRIEWTWTGRRHCIHWNAIVTQTNFKNNKIAVVAHKIGSVIGFDGQGGGVAIGELVPLCSRAEPAKIISGKRSIDVRTLRLTKSNSQRRIVRRYVQGDEWTVLF